MTSHDRTRQSDSAELPMAAGERGPSVDGMLNEDRRAGRIREATGPRPLSFADAVEELAEGTGRTIRYLRVTTGRYAALLAGQDVPEDVVADLGRVMDTLVDSKAP
jgi:uncharacterized protein YbjT (DUF2867 family)